MVATEHPVGGSRPPNFVISTSVTAPASVMNVVTKGIFTSDFDELHFLLVSILAMVKREKNRFLKIGSS